LRLETCAWLRDIGVLGTMNVKNNRRLQERNSKARFQQLWHPEVPGPLWNGTKRVRSSQIAAYCRVVAREFRPQRIILFGSYAAGCATPESDVDLIVVMPFHGDTTDQVVAIRGRAEAPFPMDLLVWKPSRMRRRDSFTQAVLNEGKLMYEARYS
jgi:predicted nucleotidyltransferase